VPLRSKRKGRFFDVPVQDMTLRIAGSSDELYEEARAAGMHFWEQIQSYAIRNPAFRTSKRPLAVPEGVPEIIRRMADEAALAGVGPMFTFQGALTEFVGLQVARNGGEVLVSSGGDYFVIARRRARLHVYPGLGGGVDEALSVVVKPELGPQGIYTTAGRTHLPADTGDGVVVVASTCILADAAAAGALAILSKPKTFRTALAYLKGLAGVHGAMIVRGEHIGVAGALELAA
jgi:ApbE superfamily uncharacterized protein (UPF0280 family)